MMVLAKKNESNTDHISKYLSANLQIPVDSMGGYLVFYC